MSQMTEGSLRRRDRPDTPRGRKLTNNLSPGHYRHALRVTLGVLATTVWNRPLDVLPVGWHRPDAPPNKMDEPPSKSWRCFSVCIEQLCDACSCYDGGSSRGGHLMPLGRTNRRTFIAGLGSAAAWPLVTRAQPSEKTRRLSYLHGLAESDPEAQARIVAFQQALAQLGWIKGLNITINHRFAGGDPARAQVIAADVVDSAPDLIVSNSTPVLAAIKRATTSIPVVFAVVND